MIIQYSQKLQQKMESVTKNLELKCSQFTQQIMKYKCVICGFDKLSQESAETCPYCGIEMIPYATLVFDNGALKIE